MTPEEFRRVREIYEEALAMSHSGRRALLEQACQGNREMLAELERLLQANERIPSWLDQPIAGAARSCDSDGVAALIGDDAESPLDQSEVLAVLTEQHRGVLVVVEVENDLRLRGVVGRSGRRNHGRCVAQAVQAPASAKRDARCGVAIAPNKV